MDRRAHSTGLTEVSVNVVAADKTTTNTYKVDIYKDRQVKRRAGTHRWFILLHVLCLPLIRTVRRTVL